MYRLYNEVKVSTEFIKLRAKGTRIDKSVETVTYNIFINLILSNLIGQFTIGIVEVK